MPTTNNGMDQVQGRDTFLGFRAPFQLNNPRTGAAPLALDDDLIVASILPVAGGTQTFTIANQPDVPRNIIMTLTDADAGIQEVNALVIGTDWWGNPMQERLIANAAGVITGDLPFWVVSSVTAVTTGTVSGADRVKFGIGNKLGIPVRLKAESDIIAKREDANQDTTGVIEINAGGISTWTPATVPDAANHYYMVIASRYGVIS